MEKFKITEKGLGKKENITFKKPNPLVSYDLIKNVFSNVTYTWLLLMTASQASPCPDTLGFIHLIINVIKPKNYFVCMICRTSLDFVP